MAISKITDNIWNRHYHGFLIIIGFWIYTHDHLNFALSIKVVLKKMSHFGVPVWHHLEKEGNAKVEKKL